MRTLLNLISMVVLLAQWVAAQKRPMAFSDEGWILNGSVTRVAQVAGREALLLGTGRSIGSSLPSTDPVGPGPETPSPAPQVDEVRFHRTGVVGERRSRRPAGRV